MTLSFTTVDVPEQTRPRKENEFVPLVREMEKDKQARAFVAANKTPEDAKEIEKTVALIQAAGREAGVTVRKMIESGKGGKDKATVTVWVVERITRERKPKDEDSEQSAK